MTRILTLVALFFLGTVLVKADLPSSPLFSKKKDSPILLKADEVYHEDELDLVIARGNVQISDGKEIIEADTVTYNKKTNTVSASGNVRFYKSTGDVITGNYMEVTEDLKDGFINQVYVLTPTKEKFAANKAYKQNKITTFDQGIYSPCNICKKDPESFPLWQLKASQIKRDEEAQDIVYKNVVLDFKGVPVFYLPYFKHPDPTVERRTGVLMPFVGNNTELGMILGVPYYISLNPSQDLILQPTIMTKQDPLLAGEYRKAFLNGKLSLAGSITKMSNKTGTGAEVKTNPSKIHGHILGDAQFDLSDSWRFKGNLARTTSPTYFKKYYFLDKGRYANKNTLDSKVEVEGFSERNYLTIKGYDFQNLRPDISNKNVPLVAPLVEGTYRTNSGRWGEYFQVDGSQMYVTRTEGARVERLSSTVSLNIPYVMPVGILTEFQGALRGDMYDIRKFSRGVGPEVNQSTGRSFPQASLTFKYPWVTTLKGNRLILEPLLGFVALPNGLNKSIYPNEDSQDFELEPSNLMRTNRFPGLDKIDQGQRMNYGFNINYYSKSTVLVKAFVGQSYSFSKTPEFPEFSGISKGLSDYVAQVGVMPHPDYKINWSVRVGKKNFKIHKNLIQITAGPPIFNINIDYVQINRDFFENRYVKREQLTGTLSSQFHKDWSVFARAAHEFGYKKGELEHGGGLKYQDECFTLRIDAFRTFYKDRDIVPSKTIMLTIGLKNLGEYSTGPLKAGSVARESSQPRTSS